MSQATCAMKDRGGALIRKMEVATIADGGK